MQLIEMLNAIFSHSDAIANDRISVLYWMTLYELLKYSFYNAELRESTPWLHEMHPSKCPLLLRYPL